MIIKEPELRDRIKRFVAANGCSWFIGDDDDFCAMSLYEDGCECRRIVKYDLPKDAYDEYISAKKGNQP